MNRIEDILDTGKVHMDGLEIPEELESRLAKALDDRRSKTTTSWKMKAIALCLAFLIVTSNYSTLAYYGKRLVGYDQIMTETLQQLNELGKGQLIGESYTFGNGLSLTLDGVMIDDNQLLAFYTITDPEGGVDWPEKSFTGMHIRGLLTRYEMRSGQGEMNEDGTEVKWVTSFEPPRFFEKTLRLRFFYMDNGVGEQGEIAFKLDRSKAMTHTLKKTINHTLEVEGVRVRFESILASPTRTVISGSIQNIMELARDQLRGERLRPNNLTIKLLGNGQEIPLQGGGMRTDMGGITFEHGFDALPKELQSLEIQVERLSVDRDVNHRVNFDPHQESQSLEILGEKIQINSLVQRDGITYLTLTSDEGTVLTRVYLLIDGERVELDKTVTDDYRKELDGRILHTRTLQFPSTGDRYELVIERMTSVIDYSETIPIPLK